MNTLKRLLYEMLWLAGAGVCAWFFPKTVVAIVAFGVVVTLALRMVEKTFE